MCSMHNPNLKGAVAEQAIVLEAMRLGVPVLRPVAEHGRVDLGLDIGDRLWRVQCKWGRLSPSKDAVIVKVSGSWWSSTGYVRNTYHEGEIDLLAAYCGELERCYLLPASMVTGRHQIQLRLRAARNGQRACINLASDFEFQGAIAQLGERSAGSRKVVGSNPTSSTPGSEATIIASHPFREHFGYWLERVAEGEEVVVTHRGKPRILLKPVNG